MKKKTTIYVGTSGWAYNWNLGGNLLWFTENSGLNSIELNMSFYRFPFPNIIKGWTKIGKNLRWSIKVNRLITHIFKFSEKAFESWKRFEKLFESMNNFIDFYLFQLPPSVTPGSTNKIKEFIKKTKLKERFALEFRNKKWFEWLNNNGLEWCKKLKITPVSIDAPEFSRDVFNVNGIVYERVHGRSGWYSHDYSDKELREIADKILKTKPKKVYVYFNNNHSMLKNAQSMMKVLKSCL